VTVDGHQSVNRLPVYIAVFVGVEVDTWTGQMRIVRAAMGSDRGTFINPGMVVRQLEERLSKGAGSALYEDNQ
jgi:xanthine dehydrogenase molybdenum-binding subunit